MAELRLFYATNRNYLGDDRWRPTGYGKKFSDDGIENLRFGRVAVKVDEAKVTKYLETDREPMGRGDGEGLIKYLAKCAESADIVTYREKINRSIPEKQQDNIKLGSQAAFSDLQAIMRKNTDVVIFIHGFNVPDRRSRYGPVASGNAEPLSREGRRTAGASGALHMAIGRNGAAVHLL